MSIKILIDDRETEYESSKFFGEILMPSEWLEKDIFSMDEFFLCQINLEELNESCGRTLLPSEGMLYFFIDYGKKPRAVVRYTTDELDAYTCFNEEWDTGYDVESNFPITFSSGDTDGTALLVSDKFCKDDEIVLLRFVPSDDGELDFLCDSYEPLYFVIKKEDLKNKDFSKVELIGRAKI